jgi:hypothetical protein
VRLETDAERCASALAMRPTSPTTSRTAQRWHSSTLDMLRSLTRQLARRRQSSQCSESGLSGVILIRRRTTELAPTVRAQLLSGPRWPIVNGPCRIQVPYRNAFMLNLSWRAFTFGGLICSASRRHSQPESEMLEPLLSGRGRQGVGVTHNRLFCPVIVFAADA